MFRVKVIENKEEQKKLCVSCNTDYIADAFAYAAYDVVSANDDVGEVIGICQFSFIGGCVLHCLAFAEGRENDEAMLILGFAVLEFLRKCSFTEVTADIPDNYATRLGFKKSEDNYILDLTAGRACGGHSATQEKHT